MTELNGALVDVMSSDYAILDFYSRTCKPCKTMHQILEGFEKQHPEISVFRADVETHPGEVGMFGVMTLPTLIFLRRGKIKKALHGLISMQRLEREFN